MGENHQTVKWFHIVPPIGGLVCILVIVLIVRRIRRKHKLAKCQRHHSSTVYIVPERQSRTVPDNIDFLQRHPVYKNQESPGYLVPFSALPPTFDFSARDIEVYGDYVILKDLQLLRTTQNADTVRVHHEAYKKQQAYNPDFYHEY